LLQSDTIRGFMFLLKGRFSWKERASKVWLKKGKLSQTNVWTKLDYCKLPAKLKYGTASVRVWLVIETPLDDRVAFV
jgi:ribosomal protein S3